MEATDLAVEIAGATVRVRGRPGILATHGRVHRAAAERLMLTSPAGLKVVVATMPVDLQGFRAERQAKIVSIVPSGYSGAAIHT